MTARTALDESLLRAIDAELAGTDRLLAERYPGERPGRQPVHTVYVPAGAFEPSLARQWGDRALALVAEHGGMASLASLAGAAEADADALATRVGAKLETEPIEDLRIDFEDGYGSPGDAEEDAAAVRAASALAAALRGGEAPPSFGIRFKCLEAATRRRGLRTLDLFLGTLLDASGGLPEGFVLTLPKVSTASQVAVMAEVCAALEGAHSLDERSLLFEVQVETPQVILGHSGSLPVAELIGTAAGRLTGLHFGTYDYSASLGISAEHQSLEHPAADYAKHVMQAAAAGTGVRLSDGSTNIVPVGDEQQLRSAWQLHARLVRRSLERAYYQGWDLHPGQLPTRFLANYRFYREGFGRAGRRVRDYLSRTEGGFMDEPATMRALAGFILRGVHCGAISEQEALEATGASAAELAVHARPAHQIPDLEESI